MSADLLAALDEFAPSARPVETQAPRLRPVEQTAARRRPRLAYGIVAVLGAAAIVAAQMVVSILTTQDTYAISALTSQQRQLTWDRQILYDEVAGLSSPQYLAANASALGMVISEAPTFLRLSDGALVGASQAAGWQSSIDAVGRGAVANALITQTPLVTDPAATIEGTPVEVTDETGQSVIPPALTDGLPTPTTR
ncbi:MAG: hypothetical protein DSY74_05065 [Actinobacteria bacterium]|jgi:hypothetical protein|uniref:hypothetical protein n=1 Tax=Microbacterium TaxID=33882 RepID=UPI000C515876|nr:MULTISPECIES: hypothetical protein [Microbacterium]MEC8762312.1 hypothetical protein [Actinomycetota bacterium]MBU20216.1 hypothetical protein [Microbacterium sp.]MCC4268148.1 hypothetical protein [Microbacterium schleiferi]RCL91068.1 MAG: hypothetical protein DBW62_02870 [Microbacterium sp.]RUA26468.1 MAG: hypothetical protein DSY74_05065 [Actinomycetota bacterium]|tara:strand:- start:190 stop:777 length:588 start_codon:yes stop_codon:yes gene_type:complete